MKLERGSNLGVNVVVTGVLGLFVSMAACGSTTDTTSSSTGTGGYLGMGATTGTGTGTGTGSDTGTGTGASGSGSTGSGMIPPPTSASKIDLLLMIDNSRSMADKQEILGAAVPDLVQRLINPSCVDTKGVPASPQPAGPLDACPSGTKRVIKPVTDIHIGVISSSLGGHGANTCSPQETFSCGGSPNFSNNDAGHLLARTDVCAGQTIPTYQKEGFLAWDPAQKLQPPGEASVGDLGGAPGLIPTFRNMVVGVGQIGCGFESQLESWYRFLVDPEPYNEITVVNGKATPSGTDVLLLAQRANFLRPSSLLTIVMLTDENDCSTKETGQFYLAGQQKNPADPNKAFHLPRARSECKTNPNDPCCKSCGQAAGSCPADPACTASPTLSDAEDDINLRCFDQKRRFGIDFLYPIDRYTAALKSPLVPNRAGEMVPNPIFTDLNPTDADFTVRDANLVVLAGIVGVPWQSVARDPADLSKGFRSADEMVMKDASGNTGWDVVLGDPANYVAPKDKHMVESSAPRPGLPAPGSSPSADPIHGHEYTNSNDDLQYACSFPLAKPRDCAGSNTGCDCGNPTNDNPLCDPNNPTMQLRAKGYPSLRELSLLRSVGSQGVVTSVCAAQVAAPSQPDYGYRPAMAAITAAITPHLAK